ncbi:hypothetical protein CHCC20441_2640 [Bacillus licheniformis]|nr:hypothetical protein B4092_1409 [Bacillus licheniformis]KYC81424.1 hypothetical protein B4090_1191 [Bacillus licheniformis]KYC85053.1 hypothetical protein B4091_1114 [Bacillus licheniformis]KYC93866.1 hypothetical protein B4164_1166 [Bacillus licheniformis]OLF88145.1 hypothetical protein B4094_3759 [Bacillus licheniformis]
MNKSNKTRTSSRKGISFLEEVFFVLMVKKRGIRPIFYIRS